MSKLDDAVVSGVRQGMTAKECSYATGFPPSTLTNRAKRLGLAFKWAKVAKIPTHMAIPPQTVAKRHRDTVRLLMTAIETSLKASAGELPDTHVSILPLVKALGTARRRNNLRA